MIHRESWYREAEGKEVPYLSLLQEWERSTKDDPELLEEILRMHRRLGRPPEETIPLVEGWEWDQLQDIPLELLPPVTFQIRFWIERIIDTSSWGVADQGYLTPTGEVSQEPQVLEMPVSEFLTMLETQEWSAHPPGLSRDYWIEGGPSLELNDHRESEEAELMEISMPLYHLRNQVNYYWDQDPEDLDEAYLQDLAGWMVTLVITDRDGRGVDVSRGYLSVILEGTSSEGKL